MFMKLNFEKHQAAEVLFNETCVDLLFKIIHHAFSSGRVPSEWSKGIIKPLPKGEDLRYPRGKEYSAKPSKQTHHTFGPNFAK